MSTTKSLATPKPYAWSNLSGFQQNAPLSTETVLFEYAKKNINSEISRSDVDQLVADEMGEGTDLLFLGAPSINMKQYIDFSITRLKYMFDDAKSIFKVGVNSIDSNNDRKLVPNELNAFIDNPANAFTETQKTYLKSNFLAYLNPASATPGDTKNQYVTPVMLTHKWHEINPDMDYSSPEGYHVDLKKLALACVNASPEESSHSISNSVLGKLYNGDFSGAATAFKPVKTQEEANRVLNWMLTGNVNGAGNAHLGQLANSIYAPEPTKSLWSESINPEKGFIKAYHDAHPLLWTTTPPATKMASRASSNPTLHHEVLNAFKKGNQVPGNIKQIFKDLGAKNGIVTPDIFIKYLNRLGWAFSSSDGSPSAIEKVKAYFKVRTVDGKLNLSSTTMDGFISLQNFVTSSAISLGKADVYSTTLKDLLTWNARKNNLGIDQIMMYANYFLSNYNKSHPGNQYILDKQTNIKLLNNIRANFNIDLKSKAFTYDSLSKNSIFGRRVSGVITQTILNNIIKVTTPA